MNFVVPSAVAPGQATEVVFSGEHLAGATELWTSFAATAIVSMPADGSGSSSSRAVFRLTPSLESQVGIGAVRVVTTNGVSSLHLFMIDDLPGVVASGSNRTVAAAQELKLPVAVDGACEALKSDYYRFTARKGQRVSVEVVAARLGSKLDPLVRVLDATGRELVYCDDEPGVGPDCRFAFKAASAGAYVIELRDANYHGGSQHRYRLRVGDFPLASVAFPIGAKTGTIAAFKILGREMEEVRPASIPWPPRAVRIPIGVKRPGGQGSGFVSAFVGDLPSFVEVEPNDTTNAANKIAWPIVIHGRFEKARDRDYFEFQAPKEQRLVFRGRTRSLGSPCDLFLQLQNADGSKAAEANVTGANEGTITNTSKTTGTYRLLIEELNHRGGPDLAYQVEIEPWSPGFALSVDTERIEATAGGGVEVKVNVARRDYSGPITFSMEGAGDGFRLDNGISSDVTNATLKVKVPDRCPAGTFTQFHIVGRAKIGETEFVTTASTMPALRKLFPLTAYPPPDLDGLIGLGVRAATNSADRKE